jgi:proline iminopeptidase
MVEVPGATLWTESQGAGVPLVLCHGGPGLSDNLGPVAAMVDDVARVHRFDQRGSGRSRSDGPFDVDAMVGDLEALRRHWGHERWVLGGHSWGASLALFYALAHPDRALGVIYLCGTGLRWGWQEDAQRRRLARLTADERAELAALEARLGNGDPAVVARFLRLMWTTDFADRARADAFLDAQPLYAFPRDERVFRAVAASQRARLDAGIDDAVRALDVPVLAIHGAEDTDPARARAVAELAPRGRYVRIADAAHSPWLERPEPLRAALRGFLGALV